MNKKFLEIIFVGHLNGEVLVQCPVCLHLDFLMRGFSLLSAGFNGIRPGDPADLDLQECGQCQSKLAWDSISTD